MKKLFFIFGFIVMNFSMTAALAKSPHRVRQISSDVFVQTVDPSFKPMSTLTAPDDSNLKNCRDHIKDIVCLVDRSSPNQSMMDRKCEPESSKYIPKFEEHFDRSNPMIQKMYCHLSKLWVEKIFSATAYATLVVDPNGTVTGGGVGVRQDLVENPLPFDSWISWKEETSFGGSAKPLDPHLNLINYKSNHNSKDFSLDYALAHEFGHLFDFANELNHFDDCRYDEVQDRTVGACTPKPGSWSELSWKNHNTPTDGNDYPLRKNLCFYFCGGHFMDRAQSADLFEQLVSTVFVSTYASWSPWEDWAENFALFTMAEEQQFQWGLETQNKYYDLGQHFSSDLVKPKKAYVKKFIDNPYVYPGQIR